MAFLSSMHAFLWQECSDFEMSGKCWSVDYGPAQDVVATRRGGCPDQLSFSVIVGWVGSYSIGQHSRGWCGCQSHQSAPVGIAALGLEERQAIINTIQSHDHVLHCSTSFG